MAYLFTVNNNIARPHTETLLIEPFKTIWERDKDKDKAKAIKDFTYIELMSSKKKTNPFAGYDDKKRNIELCKLIFNNPLYEVDDLVKKGILYIEELQKEASPTYKYYQDTLITAEKTRTFLKNIDLSEKNPKTGNPLYKPNDVVAPLKSVEDIIKVLVSLKEKVEQELFEDTRIRGNKEINPFEI